ncbi:hypothetical protein IWQ60_005195 [Tieghemiomyces parasiticus]|uniref:Uncharacterized protein n=1 Tax=Tieghemiomyces parasiticus TaxID=78921 RepID=A0A9W8DYG2_9FUNG|nr:hypothetical protein IWQ60_005195 [Tieghemiomyces parasiticus]
MVSWLFYGGLVSTIGIITLAPAKYADIDGRQLSASDYGLGQPYDVSASPGTYQPMYPITGAKSTGDSPTDASSIATTAPFDGNSRVSEPAIKSAPYSPVSNTLESSGIEVDKLVENMGLSQADAQSVVVAAEKSPNFIQRQAAKAVRTISKAKTYILKEMGQDVLSMICHINKVLLSQDMVGLIPDKVTITATTIPESSFTNADDSLPNRHSLHIRHEDILNALPVVLNAIMKLLQGSSQAVRTFDTEISPNGIILTMKKPVGDVSLASPTEANPPTTGSGSQKLYSRSLISLLKPSLGLLTKVGPELKLAGQALLQKVGIKAATNPAAIAMAQKSTAQVAKTGLNALSPAMIAAGTAVAAGGLAKAISSVPDPVDSRVLNESKSSSILICKASNGKLATQYSFQTREFMPIQSGPTLNFPLARA